MKNPEAAIKYAKEFINELSIVQNVYFDGLCEGLGLTDEGRDWMFDYVFNENDPLTFEEYLKKYGKTFGELK
jgi:hypothetical protein